EVPGALRLHVAKLGGREGREALPVKALHFLPRATGRDRCSEDDDTRSPLGRPSPYSPPQLAHPPPRRTRLPPVRTPSSAATGSPRAARTTSTRRPAAAGSPVPSRAGSRFCAAAIVSATRSARTARGAHPAPAPSATSCGR